MSRLQKVLGAGKAFLQVPAGHVERGPFGGQFCSTYQNFISFSQMIHEYTLTIKTTTAIDRNVKKTKNYYLNFYPMIMFSCLLKIATLTRLTSPITLLRKKDNL